MALAAEGGGVENADRMQVCPGGDAVPVPGADDVEVAGAQFPALAAGKVGQFHFSRDNEVAFDVVLVPEVGGGTCGDLDVGDGEAAAVGLGEESGGLESCLAVGADHLFVGACQVFESSCETLGYLRDLCD